MDCLFWVQCLDSSGIERPRYGYLKQVRLLSRISNKLQMSLKYKAFVFMYVFKCR